MVLLRIVIFIVSSFPFDLRVRATSPPPEALLNMLTFPLVKVTFMSL